MDVEQHLRVEAGALNKEVINDGVIDLQKHLDDAN